MDLVSKKIEDLVRDGWDYGNWNGFTDWTGRVGAFLRRALGEETANEFWSVVRTEDPEVDRALWATRRQEAIGMLEGIVAQRSEFEQLSTSSIGGSTRANVPASRRVFVVHGHDHGAKEMVARYLDRLDLEPVILHEKPNEGQTVIEKIEAHSDVGFAVVLLTPDDVGAMKADAAKLQPRARQNVVLELGYFVGKLKRSRVCALYVPGVEIPSDFSGVLYVELDEKGAWRTQLAQELSNARMPINVAGLLNS